MVLITPYRPVTTPIVQETPYQVSAKVASVAIVGKKALIDAPPATRQTILESHFGGGFNAIKNRFNWDFCTLTTDGGNTASVSDAGTMNGWGASDVTFPAGSSPNVRAFGNFVIDGNSYDEGWLTIDIMYLSPFSLPKGIKQPGVYTPTNPRVWSCRYMCHGTDRANNNAPLGAHMYTPEFGTSRWNWNPDYELDLDTVCRVEAYFKVNSAFNASDGILRQKFDTGTGTAHATPETIRRELTGLQLYSGSEANRAAALVNRCSCHLFFGGATTGWAPTIDSTFRIGRVAFEVPV